MLPNADRTLRLQAAGFSNSTFHLVVLPTRACQCACTYCYEAPLKSPPLSTDHLLSRVKRLIELRRGKTEKFFLNWFGGEPTLCLEKICSFLKTLKDDGISFSSGITTNFVDVTRDKFEMMLECGITSYQITFDGDSEYHDRRRYLHKGTGTWEKIINNLSTIGDLKDKFRILIRLHYHGDNKDSLLRLIPILADKFGNDGRFIFHLKKIAGCFRGDMSLVENDSTEISKQLEDFGLSILKSDHICYAGKGNSLAACRTCPQ